MKTSRKILLSGLVQGVGFRPFIYRIAIEHNLTGWVRNCMGMVEICIQGSLTNIELFIGDIFTKKPLLATPVITSNHAIESSRFDCFEILESSQEGETHISVPVDLFLCDDCLTEFNQPENRRYHYPFINCTQCGPRYTLINKLPYDRPNTSMANFKLCAACQSEYETPENRRFHAEPIACADCGPSLIFEDGEVKIHDTEDAISACLRVIKRGKVVAVKGIGGYHLMCDATNSRAIEDLRKHKNRPHKPLAVMFPSPVEKPFQYACQSVELDAYEKKVLLQPSRPILLVRKLPQSNLSEEISPGLNLVGVMLPYSPLHHLLLDKYTYPLVATSANISGEPVLIKNEDVNQRLSHVAEAFLHHDRPIVRPADDPVLRIISKKARPVRIGRGLSPMELSLPFKLEKPVLALGAHMKNVITLAWDNRAVISPHIGEMNSVRSLHVFENTINDLQKLYAVKAELIICDAHKGYTTSRWADKQNLPVNKVYHHHAHASAAYYECETTKDTIIFSWDGVGYGQDATLWGGETFLGKPGAWQQVATMRPFYLPGGDKAGREPWRSAAALCWECDQVYKDIPENDPLLHQAWKKKLNTPRTSSVGRLFDAVSALTGVRSIASFEGQGPMEFEAICSELSDYIELELKLVDDLLITDWQPVIAAMLNTKMSISERSALFHASMAQVICQQAIALRAKHSINTVSFSGGVFQNKVLTEYAMKLLNEQGFKVSLPELIPVNDAGISFGQIIEYGFY